MTIHLKHDGRPVTARMPTLDELTALIAEGPEKPLALKKLARGCVLTPPWGELTKAKPAAGVTIGIVIAGMSGLVAGITQLDPEDPDAGVPAEVATAYVALEAKGIQGLAILRTEVVESDGTAHARHFILSCPTETNTDKYLAAEQSVRAAKTFVEPICCYPAREELDKLQQEAPGLYFVLAKNALGRAGLADTVQLGES